MQQFASAPQAVGARSKYRPDEPLDTTGKNIMHDKRVVRGNTYASLVMPQNDAAEVQKQRDAQRRRLMRANQTKRRSGTPEPVIGRKHMDIQTDSYLEELTERTVEFEAETQTDFLLDRPPSPLYMPAKVGVDIDTQIEEGELFDFDREVAPVLEVICGKTLEQSMMEVLEEEELESIRRHQDEYEQMRNAELLEVQRMEAAEKRRADEQERRLQQEKSRKEADNSLMQKVLSRNIAFGYLGGLQKKVMAQLVDAGTFQDPIQDAVEATFLPNLIGKVMDELTKSRRDRALADQCTVASVNGRMQRHGVVLAKEKERIQFVEDAERKVRAERAEARRLAIEEALRVESERVAMMDWEAQEPPPDPGILITGIIDGAGKVTLEDGRTAIVPEAMLEDIKTQFDGLASGEQLRAFVGEDSEEGLPLTEFKKVAIEAADGAGGGSA